MGILKIRSFVCRQIDEIRRGGYTVAKQKLLRQLRVLPVVPPALAFILLMRLLSPWFVIRLNRLNSSRIGHFATNTELYLCEKDVGIDIPNKRFADICFFEVSICNQQLAAMWSRLLTIWPAWFMAIVYRLNDLIPGGDRHVAGITTNSDRDVHDLLARLPAHLAFTQDEHERAKAGLRAMGIPEGAEFICLAARDSAYLEMPAMQGLAPGSCFDYHKYRDVDVQSFVPAMEALADLGYFVIRMGAAVHSPLRSGHPKVIDYATNGMRSDFMDVYLGANCLLFISCGTGIDAIATTFRKPIANVNYVPVGYFSTFLRGTIGIFKKHRLIGHQRDLSLREIFEAGVANVNTSMEYSARNIELIDNTPDEIKSLVLEALARLKDSWQPTPHDEDLQRRFWEIFPAEARDTRGKPLYSRTIRARYGAQFLRDNPWFLA